MRNVIIRISFGKDGWPTIDWEVSENQRLVAKATFKKFFEIDWDLPSGFLIPRLPSRMNFLLLARDIFQKIFQRLPRSLFEMYRMCDIEVLVLMLFIFY